MRTKHEKYENYENYKQFYQILNGDIIDVMNDYYVYLELFSKSF